eukprot:scaffold7738_cov133-Cylindrotheca_fusiformis.AAC.16
MTIAFILYREHAIGSFGTKICACKDSTRKEFAPNKITTPAGCHPPQVFAAKKHGQLGSCSDFLLPLTVLDQ